MKNPMKLTAVGVALAAAAALAGVTPSAAAAPATTAVVAADKLPSSIDDFTVADYRSVLDRADVPADVEASLSDVLDRTSNKDLRDRARIQERLGVDNPVIDRAIARVIDPDDYECNPTRLDAYVDGLLAELSDPFVLLLLSFSGALDMPTYDALLNGQDLPKQFDGGTRNKVINQTLKKLKGFWDVKSADIIAVPMTGSIFADESEERAITLYVNLTGGDPEDPADRAAAKDAVDSMKELIDSEPSLDGGNNPIFSLNAYAFTAEGDPDPLVSGLADRIAFGDGLFAALDAMDFGDPGARGVMSHEFAHHVQYELDVFGDEEGPEATRRTELMADGMGMYSVSHKLGLKGSKVDRRKAIRSFRNVGDCQFDSPGHHGTPNQREKAARWGVKQFFDQKNRNKIVKSKVMVQRFEKVLPVLVEPDA